MATPMLDTAIRLEAGTSADLDEIMEIMEAAFGRTYGEAWTRSQCAGILPMAGVSLTVARDADRGSALGFSLVRSVADEAELLLIAVIPSEHRKGIGSRLLDRFIDTAQADGIRRVHLEVREGNPAVRMYQVAGFAPVGRRRNYYHAGDGRRFDSLTLVRNI